MSRLDPGAGRTRASRPPVAEDPSSADAGTVLGRFLDRRHRPVLIVLALLFLALESYYCVFRSFAIDEFNVALQVERLKSQIPYLDYTPYKTVLGYYFYLPFFASADDPWVAMVRARLAIAWLTGLSMLAAAWWACRRYRPAAVCLAFAMLSVMTSFTEKAIELRVDMPTGLAGLLSLILLLERRVALAGVAAGVSFLVSQKGALFAIAGGLALAAWLLLRRDRQSLRQLVTFCGFVALPIALYAVAWSLVGAPEVFQATFAQKTQIKALTTPAIQGLWSRSWGQTAGRNPLYYALAALAVLRLVAATRARPRFRELALLIYGGSLAALFLLLSQPWPYYFVLLIPTLFVLHADVLSRALAAGRRAANIAWLCCLTLGIVVPLFRVPQVIAKDSDYQRRMFALADAVLGPEERYLAGAPLLYHRRQHASEYTFVSYSSATPTRGFGEEAAEVIENLIRDDIVLLIFNYKIFQLPPQIRRYLMDNYAHLCGAVWSYAPQVAAGDSAVDLTFAGTYLVGAGAGGPSEIDGRPVPSGSFVELGEGSHRVRVDQPTRLTLIPPQVAEVAPAICRQTRGFFDPHVDH